MAGIILLFSATEDISSSLFILDKKKFQTNIFIKRLLELLSVAENN